MLGSITPETAKALRPKGAKKRKGVENSDWKKIEAG
jgi:hypothetical protein